MALDEAMQEQLRMGEAARAALAEAEGRWRRERGAAAAERMRLRAEIAALTSQRPCSHPRADLQEGRSPSAKRARMDPGASVSPGEANSAHSRTEVYAMYHQAEASMRAERERAEQAEAQLARLVSELEVKLPVYRDRSERLKTALTANAGLSERLAAAVAEVEGKRRECERLGLEVKVLRSLADELAAGGSTDVAPLKEELLRLKLGAQKREADAVADVVRHALASLRRLALASRHRLPTASPPPPHRLLKANPTPPPPPVACLRDSSSRAT